MREHREPIQSLWIYWRSLRAEAGGVTRSAFDPLAVASTLPWMAMIDARTPDRFVCSVWGTMLGAAFGRDWTGDDLAETLPLAGKEDAVHSLVRIKSGNAGLLLRHRAMDDRGILVRYDKILLPLCTDGHVSHIVVAFNLRYSSALITFSARRAADGGSQSRGGTALDRGLATVLTPFGLPTIPVPA